LKRGALDIALDFSIIASLPSVLMTRSTAHYVAMAALLLALTGCKREDPERLSNVGKRISGKVDGVLNRTNDRLTLQWRDGPADPLPPLDYRVRERLRWDRDLEGCIIEVSVRDGTLVELRGSVASSEQRQRAVDLARTTLGVEQVMQYLVVGVADIR
jgi:hypothetical protein